MSPDNELPSDEPALDPDLPIIDPHHHLWYPHTVSRYFADAFHADINASGHRVLATVYVESSAMIRRHGPEHLRGVGEIEFVAGQAAMSDSGQFGPTKIAAGMVGAADFTLGDRLDDVLDALIAASGGRLRGIRGAAVWDADAAMMTGARAYAPKGLMLDKRFQAGVRRLAQRGLVYDAWQYFPQLPETCMLADAAPNTTLVIDHCGGLVRLGRYGSPDWYPRWRSLIAEIAKRPNTRMKLGGLSSTRTAFGFEKRMQRATTEELVGLWRPYIEPCIEHFGADRCMFETNFPVDIVAGSYGRLWNVFKSITAGASWSEKRALFCDTAVRTYGLEAIIGDIA